MFIQNEILDGKQTKMARTLTIFKAPQRSTTTRWSVRQTAAAANDWQEDPRDFIDFAAARQMRIGARLSSGLAPLSTDLRIPMPTNDNLRPSFLPSR